MFEGEEEDKLPGKGGKAAAKFASSIVSGNLPVKKDAGFAFN